MIISTKVCNPFKTSFIFFNIVFFLLVKIVFIDKVIKNTSTLMSAIFIVLISILIAITYAAIDAFVVYLKEKKVIKHSGYVPSYGCYLFYVYNTRYIFKLGKDSGDAKVYVNQGYLYLNEYPEDRPEHVRRIKYRINTLSKVDIFFIYLYKYTSAVLMTLCFFGIWYVYDLLKLSNSLMHVFILLLLTLGAILVYFRIIDKVMGKLSAIMKKRALSMF